jgi:hypothetical protein
VAVSCVRSSVIVCEFAGSALVRNTVPVTLEFMVALIVGGLTVMTILEVACAWAAPSEEIVTARRSRKISRQYSRPNSSSPISRELHPQGSTGGSAYIH